MVGHEQNSELILYIKNQCSILDQYDRAKNISAFLC